MPAASERPDAIQTRHLSGVITRVRAEGEPTEGDESIRYEFTASTDGVVQLWGSTFEILDHAPKSVRMDWFKSGNAPALWMHDRTQIRGIIESATLSGNKVSVIVRMSPNEDTKELIKDIDAGIIRNVSIGYRVFAEVMESREVDADGYPTKTTWRVTDWEPKEVSFVTIPADVDTGFGRAADELKTRVSYLEGLAAADISTRTNTMSDPVKPTITVEESDQKRDAALTAERGRAARIHEAARAAKKNGLGDFDERAQEAIEKNESSEDFHRHV
ncbi:MAG: phage major capsid protein family, partial [Akkermansiaceae bacterium]|nr:phage major capsid protein family [Akkermansiaceae bacterium]